MEATKSTASMDPITYGRTQRQADVLGFGKALLATFTEYNVFTLCLKAKGFTDGNTADSAYSQAQYKLPSGYSSAPSIKVEFPSYVEEGGVVPVNLVMDGIEPSDPIESATVVVDSNPQEHRHALTVQYMLPPTKFGLRLRVRLAESTKPTISVIVTFKSGNSVTKTFGPDRVAKFVNFSQQDTLVPMPTTTAKLFSSQEIGQQRAKLGSDGFLNTLIYHPMFPAIGEKKSLLIEQILVKSTGQNDPIVVMTPGDALSNNPFVSVFTGSLSGDVVKWVGSGSMEFETKIAK